MASISVVTDDLIIAGRSSVFYKDGFAWLENDLLDSHINGTAQRIPLDRLPLRC